MSVELLLAAYGAAGAIKDYFDSKKSPAETQVDALYGYTGRKTGLLAAAEPDYTDANGEEWWYDTETEDWYQ